MSFLAKDITSIWTGTYNPLPSLETSWPVKVRPVLQEFSTINSSKKRGITFRNPSLNSCKKSFTFRLVLHLSEVLSIINLIETFLTTFLRFLWWTVRLPRHGAGPRIGDEERRLMHLVPAPAVRLMKRRVLSRPGLKSLMLAWHSTTGNEMDDQKD